jgi:serine/threonine protein kinase
MPFVVGENVGPYRITEQLGRGGMATVFKAYHAALDRYVAIKALHPAFMEDPNFLARFQREARVVAKLEHSNIVPIYDFAEYEGRPYLVMKFIEGETLKAKLVRDGLQAAEIMGITTAVGQALTYAHDEGILHRDVKPSNVLLADDDRIYLADFGLARIAQAGESTLSGDMMLGTPQYISPEQAMGVSELDKRTDIYSFGVMLYEMSVGQVPFSADTPFSIIHDHIYTPLPLPSQINPQVPEPVERVLLKALAKERDDRFPDIQSLVTAFNNVYSEDELADVQPVVGQSAPTLHEGEIVESSVQKPVVRPIPASAEPKKKKPFFKRLRWWQIALLIIFSVFCCLIVLGTLNENRKQRQGDQEATQTTSVELLPTLTSESDVIDTRQQIDEDFLDPDTLITLGSEYLRADQIGLAAEAFDEAIAISDGAYILYQRIADIYFEHEVWIHATQMYLEIARGAPEHMDTKNLDKFQQSGFMAAGTELAEEKIPLEAIKEVDEVFEQTLKARNRLFAGDPAQAQEILDAVYALMPDFPLADLVQAEILFANQEATAARQYIEKLMRAENTPFWIKEYIRSTLYGSSSPDQERFRIPTVDEARAAVAEDENDPWRRLALVEALINEGQFDDIEAQLTMAFELSDNSPEVYFQAGEIFSRHLLYGYAAIMYITSANIHGQPLSEEANHKLAEAVYLSSANRETLEQLSDYQEDIDPFLVDMARIRFMLHNEDRDQALVEVTALKEAYPQSSEALLLEAEILYILGDERAAFEQWERITKDESVPFWVRNQAGNFLKKLDK